jgi:hypothetical protein
MVRSCTSTIADGLTQGQTQLELPGSGRAQTPAAAYPSAAAPQERGLPRRQRQGPSLRLRLRRRRQR